MRTHRYNSHIVTLKFDSVSWVSAVEFMLQRGQGKVVPRCVAETNLFNDRADKPVAECLA